MAVIELEVVRVFLFVHVIGIFPDTLGSQDAGVGTDRAARHPVTFEAVQDSRHYYVN